MLLFFAVDAAFIYALFCPLFFHAGVAAAAAAAAKVDHEAIALEVFHAAVVDLPVSDGGSVALGRL